MSGSIPTLQNEAKLRVEVRLDGRTAFVPFNMQVTLMAAER